jgi:hypothetical protein
MAQTAGQTEDNPPEISCGTTILLYKNTFSMKKGHDGAESRFDN